MVAVAPGQRVVAEITGLGTVTTEFGSGSSTDTTDTTDTTEQGDSNE